MIKLYRSRGMKVVLWLLDGLMVYAGCLLAERLLVLAGRAFPLGAVQEAFFRNAPWLVLFTIVTYYFFNLYDLAGRRKPSQFLFNLVLAQLFIAAELIVFGYGTRSFFLPPWLLFATFFVQLLLSFGLRLLLFFVQSQGIGRKRTLVVVGPGSPSDLTTLHKIMLKGKPWFHIERIIQSAEAGERLPEHVWTGIEALIVGPGLPSPAKAEWVRLAGRRNVEVVMIPDFYELYLADAEPQQIDDLLVYSLMPPHLSLPERLVKRLFDLLVSGLLLLAASPVMLFMFAAIPLTSKGKALYVQERVGLAEKPFPLYKFRSMVEDAEGMTGPVLAGRDDPRITRLGRFMRSTRIDELPQLFNVLLGQMSLVGPRPERAFFINRFKEELPHYTYRMMVKPGLTGYAQVMAGYATTPSDKLRYDLMYIKRYSLLLDIQILFQTIRVILQREQAKGVEQPAPSPAPLPAAPPPMASSSSFEGTS
ncbi:sugar transferase [Paenibacillus sp. FSL R5-0527]|uniref:sugar transferase n=1 Tax=Paenibacillus sp. FSL R5-0527 TaxID=2975321 RepID=UPI00097A257A|nr:hypothetical protein BK140_17565 [Paenibacillus macerans]